MSVVNAIPLLLGDEGYNISRSVRLRSSASAYFNRTPGSASNRKTWTYSGWIKRGALADGTLLSAGTIVNGGAENYLTLYYSSNALVMFNRATTNNINVSTSAVFRDPSAWYHVVVAVDTTQATGANGVKIYVNGVQQTLTITTYTQNADTFVNNNVAHSMGRFPSDGYGGGLWAYFDGYLTEVNFIDGQALTPSSFGETDAVTGVWKPKKYAGTYGTNGFYLNFSDNSSNTATTIGKDNSGNGNNWTPNNISVTAGVTYDSMIDVPTLYADGGNGRGNYCIANPLRASTTNADGNLKLSGSSGSWQSSAGSIAVTSGKWYWEAVPSSAVYTCIGVCTPEHSLTSNFSSLTTAVIYDARGFYDPVAGSPASYTSGDVIGVALDMDAGTLTFYKNNVAQPVISTSISGRTLLPVFGVLNSGVNWVVNFGQRPFSYTPPTGFKALNTQNLPAPTILKGNKYFDATTYTGNGSTQSIVNAGGFQPDLVWGKARSLANSNFLVDSVRGSSLFLSSDQTIAEVSNSSLVSSLNSNGYSVGNTTTANQNAATYVGWQWKANGSAVTNTSGSITSQVNAGTSQGFSVATFTAPASNQSFTVGHGLGVAPKMTILKRRDSATNSNWWIWHIGLGDNTTTYLALNQTAASASVANMWGTIGRDSTVCGFNTPASVVTSATYVAYCFSEVAGFSRFGSYTGNGSADGPFVFCGFRPRYVMVKRSDGIGDWIIYDSARAQINVMDVTLYADLSSQELNAGTPRIDFLSNGFKLRNTGEANQSGGYIFAAFAESPFKNSLAR